MSDSNITTKKFSELPINSKSASFYENYWTEGLNVSRHTNLLANWIIESFIPGLSGKRILEIGIGGEGGVAVYLAPHNFVSGVDVSISAVKNCSNMGLNISLCDISKEELPFQDNYFDYVVALEVIEHLANPQNALEEIRRVLCNDGIVLIGLPSRWSYHWPRCFYPELIYDQGAFEHFLYANHFDLVKKGQGIVPCNEFRLVPEHYKSLSSYYMARKLNNKDSWGYLKNGMIIWEKVDEYGMRLDPVSAIDLFRKSYEISQNTQSLLMLTHSLLYRVINNELEEFNKMFQLVIIKDKLITSDERNDWKIGFAKILLEANLLGIPLVSLEEMRKVWSFVPTRQSLVDFCNKLKLTIQNDAAQ